MAIGCYFVAFGAIVICIKREASMFNTFQQYCTGMRPAVGAAGGQCHGINFGYLALHGLPEPFSEKHNGVIARSLFIERAKRIILADIGWI